MRDFLTSYRLLLRLVLGKARLIALGGLGALGLLMGVALRGSGRPAKEQADAISRLLVGGFGMNLVVPITALVFASAVLGDPAEDKTLVHLWLTPVPRWRITIAGTLAAFSVAGPVGVLPLLGGVALAGGSLRLVLSTALGAALASAAFTTAFVWLGLLVRRALPWGGAYLFIWELAVARLARGAARLSITIHARSIIAHLAHLEPPRNQSSSVLAFSVLASIIIGSLGITTWALRRVDVA